MLEDDDLMMDDDFIGGSSGSYGSGGGSGLDDGELSPEEIKKQGMTVEVMDFLESYTTMCSMKNAVVVSSIQKSLQQAVEGG